MPGEPSLAVLVALAAGAAVVAGFLKTSVGGGIGLTLTPLLTLLLPPQPTLALIAVLLLLGDPITLWLYWRRWDWTESRYLLPAMLAGIVAGGWLLAGLEATTLRRVIGGAALSLGLLQLVATSRSGSRPPTPASPPLGIGVGVAAGVASTVAHSGGLVLGLYLVGRPLGNAALVATSALVVAVSDVAKVGTYAVMGWMTPSLVIASVAATPLLYVGSWLGYRLNAVLPRRAFGLALLIIAMAGAVRLLLH
jgi:uncharacterized membrane protein YfcA